MIEQLGPYRLIRILGKGGMGVVYAAVHEDTGQTAAVKTLHLPKSDDPKLRIRFEREVETLKQLRHENITQLYGYGEAEGQLFFAMELVDGVSLQDELAKGRRFSPREVCRIGIQIAAGLRCAHDHGIIHRDLKPANLLATIIGHVKLTDFGIAKGFGYSEHTAAGAILGTADYMAPEQARGEVATVRSDLYSLGCVLFSLLSRKPPFSGRTVAEVLHNVLHKEPPSIMDLVDVPDPLAALIDKLLQKDPAARIPTALAIQKRLTEIEEALGPLDVREFQAPSAGSPSFFGNPISRITNRNEGGKPRSDRPPGESAADGAGPDRPASPNAPPETALRDRATRSSQSFEIDLTNTPPPQTDAGLTGELPLPSPPTGVIASPPAGAAGRGRPMSPGTQIRPLDRPAIRPGSGPSPAVPPAPPVPGNAPAGGAGNAEVGSTGELTPEVRSGAHSAIRTGKLAQEEAGDGDAAAAARSSRYVTVEEERRQRELARPPAPFPWLDVVRWASLLVVLAVFGGTIAYLVWPESSDRLHDRIMAQAADGEDGLVAARRDVELFLTRFSDDPRADAIRELDNQIAEIRARRRAEAVVAVTVPAPSGSNPEDANDTEPTNPVERLVQQAVRETDDPEPLAERLRAILAVYRGPGDPASANTPPDATATSSQASPTTNPPDSTSGGNEADGSNAGGSESGEARWSDALARVEERLARLENGPLRLRQQERAALTARIDQAEALLAAPAAPSSEPGAATPPASDRAEALAILDGIVLLYRSQPWTRDLVDRATDLSARHRAP